MAYRYLCNGSEEARVIRRVLSYMGSGHDLDMAMELAYIEDPNFDPVHIKWRIENREKIKTHVAPNAGKKMKYFVVRVTIETCEGSQRGDHYEIIKGFSKNSVSNRLCEMDLNYTQMMDYGGYYSKDRYSDIMAEFNTEEEAQNYINNVEVRDR